MNSHLQLILNNSISAPLIFIILIISYFLQKKTISNWYVFDYGKSKNFNFTYGFALSSIFLGIFLVSGVIFNLVNINISGQKILEIDINFALISFFTLTLGCFYGSIIATLGNILSFFINSPSSPFIFNFYTCMDITTNNNLLLIFTFFKKTKNIYFFY